MEAQKCALQVTGGIYCVQAKLFFNVRKGKTTNSIKRLNQIASDESHLSGKSFGWGKLYSPIMKPSVLPNNLINCFNFIVHALTEPFCH